VQVVATLTLAAAPAWRQPRSRTVALGRQRSMASTEARPRALRASAGRRPPAGRRSPCAAPCPT